MRCLTAVTTEMATIINASDSNKFCLNESIIIILKTLNPIAPHVSQYLWKNFHGNFYHEEIESSWPEIKEDLLEVSEFELVIQINGKVRGKKLISKELNQDEIEQEAKTIENVAANFKKSRNQKSNIY